MKEYYKKAGIYKIKNIKNGKFYIGSSRNLGERFETHISKLRYNKHSNKKLQNSANKYGLEYFIFGVLEYCDISELQSLETKYIQCFNPDYNIAFVSENSVLRTPLSPENRLNMSKAHKGVPLSKEHSKNISIALKGKMPKNIELLRELSRKQIIVWFNDITPILFKNRHEVVDFFNLQHFNYKYISNLCIKGKKLQGLKIEYV